MKRLEAKLTFMSMILESGNDRCVLFCSLLLLLYCMAPIWPVLCTAVFAQILFYFSYSLWRFNELLKELLELEPLIKNSLVAVRFASSVSLTFTNLFKPEPK